MSQVYVDERAEAAAPAALRRVSWGAIIAGVTAALSVQIMLSLLGIGIGAVAFDPGQDQGSSLGIGAAIWWFVAGLIALFVGGYVAGRLAGIPRRGDGMLHGFVTWSVATLFTFYLLTTTIGGLIGGVASTFKQTVAGAAQAAVSSAAGGEQQQQNQQEPSAVDLATDPEVQQLARTAFDDGRLDDNERTQIAGLMAQKGNMSQQEAEQRLANFEQTYGQARQQYEQARQQVQQQVRERGDEAKAGITSAGLGSFFMLLLGAVAASLGGGSGAPKPALEAPREIRRVA